MKVMVSVVLSSVMVSAGPAYAQTAAAEAKAAAEQRQSRYQIGQIDVVAPSFDTTVLWSMRALDQNDLGLESALRALQSYVKAAGDANLDQALRRVELQVNPVLLARAATPAVAGARNVSGSAASTRLYCFTGCARKRTSLSISRARQRVRRERTWRKSCMVARCFLHSPYPPGVAAHQRSG